jgi:hypothetical protein
MIRIHARLRGWLSRRKKWIAQRSPGSKLVLLLLPVIVSAIVLIAMNAYIYSSNNMTQFLPYLNGNKTSLTFDGKSFFHEGNLEFLINNNEKGSLKTLSVYGLNTHDSINASSSYLVDDTHKINTNTKLTITSKNTTADAKQYDIRIPMLQFPGSYEGWIFVSGKDDVPVPVTLATEPKVVVALLWVIIGILTSIIFWEIINYINQIKKAQTNPQINEEDVLKVAQDTGIQTSF